MERLPIFPLAVCVAVALGCTRETRLPQQPVAQPARYTASALPDLVNSLTAAQIRKANAGGLSFAELTWEQQQAVSIIWAEHAARKERLMAEGIARLPAGPVEEVKIVLAGYVDLPNERSVRVDFRRGNGISTGGFPVKQLPPAFKEAGKDLVAAGIAVPRDKEEAEAPSDEQ